MRDFETVIAEFRTGKLNVEDWNFCTQSENGSFSAYIMGEGAEQCLAMKRGFESRKAVEDFFRSLGVKYILPGVG